MDVLWAFPEHEPADLLEGLSAVDDRREVVARQLAGLASEAGLAVGKEDLRLADAAGVDQQLAKAGIARRVLETDAEVELAERDPGSLARPASLDQLRVERQQPPERRNVFWARSSSSRAESSKEATVILSTSGAPLLRLRAFTDPSSEELALGVGHPRAVAERHHAGQHGDPLDRVGLRLDLLAGLETDALGAAAPE